MHGCEVNVHIEMTVSIGKIIMKGVHFVTRALAQYDGKNGNPAYVAYKGKVYDVSASFLWKDGNHKFFIAPAWIRPLPWSKLLMV